MNSIQQIQESLKKKPLYVFFNNEKFWESHNDVVLTPTRVPRYKKSSDWSLSFKDDQSLKSIFHIHNDNFETLFEKATHGRGQEKDKIMTIHSSSLMPLLFFHGVSKDNPFVVFLDGKKVELTRYVPEEQNEVEPGSKNYSNVDVALFNDKEKVVVLFESKFSEYLTPNSIEVSLTKYYKSIYEELENTFDSIGIEVADKNTYNTKIQTVKGRTPRYCEGPKQMISHFLGARTECSQKFVGYRVFLGELLFDFQNYVKGADEALKTYKNEVYKPLSKALRELSQNTVEIMPLMTYQELLGWNSKFYLEQDIIDYYRLGK